MPHYKTNNIGSAVSKIFLLYKEASYGSWKGFYSYMTKDVAIGSIFHMYDTDYFFKFFQG